MREINDFGTIRYEYNKFVEKATNISMENNVYRFMLNGVEYISKETNSKIWLYKDILEESYKEVEKRREAIKNRDYHENVRPFDTTRKKTANKKELKEEWYR